MIYRHNKKSWLVVFMLSLFLIVIGCSKRNTLKTVHLPSKYLTFVDDCVLYKNQPFTGRLKGKNKENGERILAHFEQGQLHGNIEFFGDVYAKYQIRSGQLQGLSSILAFEMEFIDDILIQCHTKKGEFYYFHQSDADRFCTIIRQNRKDEIFTSGREVTQETFKLLNVLNRQ